MNNNPIVAYKRDLDRMIEADEFALPSNVSQKAFRNAAVVAVQDNPYILQMKPESVFKSLRRLAGMGLVPDSKEAALVPFAGVCTAIPMVFGLIKAARRSGHVTDISAHLVYEKEAESRDHFYFDMGDKEELFHRPILFGDRGKPVAAYAIATLRDGTRMRELMTEEEIEKVRKAAASQRDKKTKKASDQPIGIWKDWGDEMWKKTVIRRLAKRLPLSSEDLNTIVEDDDFESMRDVTPPESTEDRLKRVAAERQAEEDQTQDIDPAPEDEDQDAPIDMVAYVPGDVFPGDPAFEEGQAAQKEGIPLNKNPYDENPAYSCWQGGWMQQHDVGDT